MPTGTALEFTAFSVDCQALSTTGYPTGSDQDHHVVIDHGQLVLEDTPTEQPHRDLVRISPCNP